MAYVYSRARKTFDTGINDLLVTSKEADTHLCSSARVRALAHASAVVIANTRVESYLEDLILDWAAAIGNANLTASILPGETRAFLLNGSTIRQAYRKLLLMEQGERDFVRLISSQLGAQGEYRFAIDATIINASHLRPIIDQVKYPSEANLRKLFARCGIADIFTALNAVAKRDVLPLHKSFSDLRTAIAHEGLPVGKNGKDVRDRIREIKMLIGYLDRVFYRHSNAHLGPTAWTT